jgi:hypothetical protein
MFHGSIYNIIYPKRNILDLIKIKPNRGAKINLLLKRVFLLFFGHRLFDSDILKASRELSLRA